MRVGNGNGNGERSPLLASRESGDGHEASEETLNGDGDLNREEDQGLVGEDADKANQHVGKRRGVLIILTVWGLIFLQAANMSGISTIQSKIASDLDAFATASWFTSSYLTSTIITFLFGLSSAKIQWIPILISPFLLTLFLLIEIYVSSDPIIPITVLKSRGALFSCIAQLGIMAGRWMLLFYTPVYAIAVRGWSPASAGAILIPTNFGFALGGVMVGWLHIKRAGSFWSACIISYLFFALTLTIISKISIPTTPTAAYIVTAFLNGICTGSALNYTLAHLLHLTPPSTHFISTSLLTTFRGSAGSFGSAIGGGLFIRVLKKGLETGFEEHGGLKIDGRKDLVRRLLGGPAFVKELEGVERTVAVDGYVRALRVLFMAGAGLAMVMVLVQAGTGWKGKEDEEVIGEDEVWEEVLESAV
ncbi:hypothetical protein B7494_g4305 [Chlorociboria aeruginascens]|nr:hypothetical protein B7494_g4305 [Chlorociboria aeruginascens]